MIIHRTNRHYDNPNKYLGQERHRIGFGTFGFSGDSDGDISRSDREEGIRHSSDLDGDTADVVHE
jgi:hypothetical protein